MRSAVLLILGLLLARGAAADFDKGVKAHEAGDDVEAARQFMKVAPLGDHRAMMALGALYAGGRGVPKDYTEALRWYREAARYGRPDAMFRLGVMYEEGLGVRANPREAARQFLEAAKLGDGNAQLKMGALYRDGGVVEQDLPRAWAWYKLAETSKAAEAQPEIAKLESGFTPEQRELAERTLADFNRRHGAD